MDLTISQFIRSPLALGLSEEYGGFDFHPAKVALLKTVYDEDLDARTSFDVRIYDEEHDQWVTRQFTETSYIAYLRYEGRLQGEPGAPRVSIIAGRRSGKTLLGMILSAYETYCYLTDPRRPACDLAYLATTRDQTLVGKAAYDDMLGQCAFLESQVDNATRQTTYFKQGLSLRTLSVPSVDRLRGATVPFVLYDELGVAAWQDLVRAYEMLDPYLDAGGPRAKSVSLTTAPSIEGGPRTNARAFRQWHEDHALSMEIPTWEINARVPLDYLKKQRDKDQRQFDLEFGAVWDFALEPEPLELRPCTCPHCGGVIDVDSTDVDSWDSPMSRGASDAESQG